MSSNSPPLGAIRVAAIAGLAIAATSFAAPAPAPPGLADDLFQNGDVEAANGRSPKHWTNTGGAGVTYDWKAVDGGHVLAIANDAAEDRDPHNWRQHVVLPAKKPARLELRARVKAPRLDAAASACVMVRCIDGKGEATAFAWCDPVQGGPSDWKETFAVFDVPAECKEVHVLAYLVGAGEVWFDDFALEETSKPPRSSDARSPDVDVKLQELVRGCASELPWRFDAAAAKKAAAAEDRALLVYVRCIDDDVQLAAAQQSLEMPSVGWIDDGLRKDVLMRAGPLSDPDVAALIERRFVPLLLTYDLSKHGNGANASDDPLAAIGTSANDVVTPALLVCDERGKLVHKLHRIGALNPALVERVLRAALAKSGAKVRKPTDGAARDGIAGAAELAAAGELDAAAKLLQGRSEPEARANLARILRRRGDLAAAEKLLAGVNGADAEVERGLVALARGDWERSLAALGSPQAAKLDESSPRRDESRYWAAFCLDRLGRHDEASAKLRELVGPTRFGRKAAACLLRNGPRLLLAENPRQIAGLPELPESTEGFDVPFDPEISVRALLDLQRGDGSLVGHMDLWDPSITAFALEAIEAWQGKVSAATKARAKDAAKRARAWLVAWCDGQPNPHTDPFHQPYVLLALARRGEQAAVAKLVERIGRLQQEDGNWTVYGADRPASFNTALNVMALAAAKAAGADVPPNRLLIGVAALEQMRQQDDLFCYSTKPGHEWMTTEHGSIARDSLCEVALLRAGAKAGPRLAVAVDRFLEHHAELRAPTKRLYDYFNARGHGGYYYFFAHWHAAEAARELPAARRKKAFTAIRKELLSCRELDGTWVDHAMLGRAYGTAQALRILAFVDAP